MMNIKAGRGEVVTGSKGRDTPDTPERSQRDTRTVDGG